MFAPLVHKMLKRVGLSSGRMTKTGAPTSHYESRTNKSNRVILEGTESQHRPNSVLEDKPDAGLVMVTREVFQEHSQA